MKERGKAVETYNNFPDFNCFSSEMPCKKHPYSSSVGICPYCLNERLVKLVCTDCGERRLSSCSCSNISSSNKKSCSRVDVGSVGRISFLIDNEKIDQHPRSIRRSKSRRRDDQNWEQDVYLRRSSSYVDEVKKSNGFWRIKRLFRKRKNKGHVEFSDENSETCVSDIIEVSRSRSLCSFRGLRYNDVDEGSDYAFSSAKISDVSNGIFFDSDKQYGFSNGYQPRKSGFRSILDGENGFLEMRKGRRNGGLNQMELDRAYSVPNKSVFPIKESDFSAMDESAFIDLKLDSSYESKHDFSAGRISGATDRYKNENLGIGESLASLKCNGMYGHGGSCRITTNERGSKRGSRNYKVWKWISRYHSATKEEKQTF